MQTAAVSFSTLRRCTIHGTRRRNLIHHKYTQRALSNGKINGNGSSNSSTLNTSTTTKNLTNKLKLGPVGSAAALVLGGAITAKLIYGSLLTEPETRHGPKRDESKITIRVNSAQLNEKEVPKLTPERLASAAIPTGKGKESKLHEINAAEFAAFCTKQQSILQTAKQKSKAASAKLLNRELQKVLLEDTQDRISSFADWYFAYKTTYTLLGIALTSAAKHAVTFRTEQTLTEAITKDIQAHVRIKYEALVLRPAITNPKIQRAFVSSLKLAHENYIKALLELEGSVSSFLLSKEATSSSFPSSAPTSNDVVVDMDWSAQLQKVEHIPLVYEKNPEFTVALVGAGVATGKVAGGTAAAGAGAAAAKALASKIAAPFATKAAGATLAKTAVTGAAGGAVIAGPVGSAAGAAAGAAIGLGIDVTVNAGVALMHRSSFEKDVGEALDATRVEWEDALLVEIDRVQDLWFGYAGALLAPMVEYDDEDDGCGDHDDGKVDDG